MTATAPNTTAPVAPPLPIDATTDTPTDSRDGLIALIHLVLAYVSLFAGGLLGLVQALVRSGRIEMSSEWYYTMLTAHGVVLALVFTTLFILGFFYAGMSRTMGGHLSTWSRRWAWGGLVLMGVGAVMTVIPIATQDAAVLYTFYAPMQASALFYIGLTVTVIGSWLGGISIFTQYANWKKANPGERAPLFGFMAVATMVLWQVATIGVAIEMLFQLIPWSLGWIDGVNVELTRTLFWYFGHPLVYFWLLPAYVAWYVIVPKVLGVPIFSEALAKLAFVLFIVFSVPVGLHHQLTEPGISDAYKYLQVSLTYAVAIPSLMTAFIMFATMERAGRRNGGKGLVGWFFKLPWKDVRFLAPFLGMATFILGGAGGLINASHQLDTVTHNTLFMPGHFHLTLATTVALTFTGISYFLVPNLMGRTLTKGLNAWGVAQTWLWFVGMLLMSFGMHTLGLLGIPRRSMPRDIEADNLDTASLSAYDWMMAIGGSLLELSIVMFFAGMLWALFAGPKKPAEFPIADRPEGWEPNPTYLERWSIWIAIVAVLVIIAYAQPIAEQIADAPPGGGSPGYDEGIIKKADG